MPDSNRYSIGHSLYPLSYQFNDDLYPYPHDPNTAYYGDFYTNGDPDACSECGYFGFANPPEAACDHHSSAKDNYTNVITQTINNYNYGYRE